MHTAAATLTVPGWLVTIGSLIVILTAIGAALALVIASFDKSRVAKLREDVDDRNERIKFLEGENTERKEKCTFLEAELKAEQAKTKNLQELVTHKSEIEHLQTSMDTYARTITSTQSVLMQKLEDILVRLEEDAA
jgi:uncharacterized protein HemX